LSSKDTEESESISVIKVFTEVIQTGQEKVTQNQADIPSRVVVSLGTLKAHFTSLDND